MGFVPWYTVIKDLETGRLVSMFDDMDILADQISIFMKERMACRPAAEILVERLHRLQFR